MPVSTTEVIQVFVMSVPYCGTLNCIAGLKDCPKRRSGRSNEIREPVQIHRKYFITEWGLDEHER